MKLQGRLRGMDSTKRNLLGDWGLNNRDSGAKYFDNFGN
jgi:hypothetical protein